MTITISRINSTRLQDGVYEQVYDIDVIDFDGGGRKIAPTNRDMLLEVARLFKIELKELTLR